MTPAEKKAREEQVRQKEVSKFEQKIETARGIRKIVDIMAASKKPVCWCWCWCWCCHVNLLCCFLHSYRSWITFLNLNNTDCWAQYAVWSCLFISYFHPNRPTVVLGIQKANQPNLSCNHWHQVFVSCVTMFAILFSLSSLSLPSLSPLSFSILNILISVSVNEHIPNSVLEEVYAQLAQQGYYFHEMNRISQVTVFTILYLTCSPARSSHSL